MLKNLFNRRRPAAASDAVPTPLVSAAASRAPDDVLAADALVVRGNALEDAGDLAQAEALYRQAVALAPGHARAHLNLGIALAAAGDNAGASSAYEAVLVLDARHPFGNYNYARLQFLRGDLPRAAAMVDAAVAAKPDFAQALVLQGSVREAQGRLEDAEQSLEAALRAQPDDAGAWFNVAMLRLRLDRRETAEFAIERLLALQPDHPAGLALRSRFRREHQFAEEVLEPLRPAIRNDPANLAYRSQELMLLNFVEDVTPAELFQRHLDFGAVVEAAHPARFAHRAGSREPHRRLRVGYVSGDLYMHPVALFLVPVLECHDGFEFEIFCYSIGTVSDHVTERVRAQGVRWRDAHAMSDARLADTIHADGIDILVDLTGHTNIPRLGVFSQRPAPVQVTWLGYLNTTGMTQMDYRLTDARCDPVETSQPLHTERLVMLPDSQWCYRPFLPSTPSPTAPLERNGYITFGSFNGSLKLTPATCRRWGELLARLPRSRLIIASLDSERLRATILREMADAGIAPDRVEFAARVGLDKYPDLISTADIALDSFPYGGGTTTFDTLWMGVPVVTAVGGTPVSRSAASILAALGLDDWIAPSIDDFVDLAAARAADHEAIVALRRSLRPRLEASPLTDVAQFTRDLEAAYRRMWMEKIELSASRP